MPREDQRIRRTGRALARLHPGHPRQAAQLQRLNEYDINNIENTDNSDKYKKKKALWHVAGHWRHYKSGKRIFIQGYWKGIQRNSNTTACGLSRLWRSTAVHQICKTCAIGTKPSGRWRKPSSCWGSTIVPPTRTNRPSRRDWSCFIGISDSSGTELILPHPKIPRFPRGENLVPFFPSYLTACGIMLQNEPRPAYNPDRSTL